MARKYFVLSAVLGVALTCGLAISQISFAAMMSDPLTGGGTSGDSIPAPTPTAATTTAPLAKGGSSAPTCTVHPAVFTATTTSACAVTLTMTPATCFTPPSSGYLVTRAPSTGLPSIFTVARGTAVAGKLPTVTHVDLGVVPESTYYYSETGLQPANASMRSTPNSVTTPAVPPAPSVNVLGAHEQGGNMIIGMRPSVETSRYGGFILSRVAGYTGVSQVLSDSVWPGTSMSYADNSYNPLTVNTYTAKFFESDAYCGALRNISSAAVVTVPGIATNLVTSVATGTTPVATLSWTPGMGQTYVEIYKKIGTGAWSLLTTATANTYADTSVAPGTSYAYRVRAIAKIAGNLGYSGFTADALAAVPALPVPVPAFNFSARVVYAGTSTADVYFQWDNNHPNFPYMVELATTTSVTGYKALLSAGVPSTSPQGGGLIKNIPASGAMSFRVTTIGVLDSSPLVTVNLDTKAIIKGTAWTSVTGWISLSCETKGTDCTTNKYNVSIGADNELRGAAWSSGLGWLSFNKADLAGCPSGACVAKLDPATNKLVGWAKFLATGQWLSLNSVPAVAVAEPSQQVAAASKIWNAFASAGDFGSIGGLYDKLTATFGEAMNTLQAYAQSAVAYGLTYAPATGVIGGQAWGGDVLGWVDFSGLSGVPAVPVVSNVIVAQGSMINPARTGGTFCDDDPYYSINWNYANSGGATQKQVKITVYNASSGVPYATTTSTGYTRYNLFDPLTIVGKGKAFTVGISAFDGTTWSTEVMSNATTTPNRNFPLVDFTWSPVPAKTAWPITFSGTSTLDRSGGTNPASGWTWQWTFPHSTSTDPTKPGATAIFDSNTASSTDVVTLTVTDPTCHCTYTQQVLGNTGVQPKKIRDIKER